MKVLIVSGFLGAGKTTFIRALARHTGKEFAIFENEYGDIGIDADILSTDTSAGRVNIWELAEGCICCSVKGDFAASVLTIANTVDPEYLVIEPTGVGYLSNVIRNMQRIEYERIRLLAPVTIVDGLSFDRYIREYPELYRDQISNAATVLASKTEQLGEAEKSVLHDKLSKINPTARIVTKHYLLMDQRGWDSLLEKAYDGSTIENRVSEEELPDTFSLIGAYMASPESLYVMLENLIRGEYGEIFRAKGQLRAGDIKLRFDVADSRYSITGADETLEDKAVFIGRDIRRQHLRRNFFEKEGAAGGTVKMRAR